VASIQLRQEKKQPFMGEEGEEEEQGQVEDQEEQGL
jgi:hypothetical protein